MATKIREDASIGWVADAVDGTCAGLECDPETVGLVPPWAALRDRADGLYQERRDLDREALRARARLHVCDHAWDATASRFGQAAVDASGGRHDQAPYTRFFAKSAPTQVRVIGIGHEIELARAWVVELARDPQESLAQVWTGKLTSVTDSLELAFNERNAAIDALAAHHRAVVFFIEEVNQGLDQLEGDLKKLFPGEPTRVAAYLAAMRGSRGGPDEPVPSPPPAAA